jgi:phosphatidylserine decarboxylase
MNNTPRPIIAHESWIRCGSRVDAYPPLDAGVKVGIGDKVSATTTILAMLPQKG